MINKVYESFDEAIADIPDGASIAIECWGFPATAHNLIAALKRKGTKDLTVITHTFIPQVFSEDLAALPSVLLPQMKKLISPIVGIMRLGAGGFVKEYVEKGMEVEVMGHGTLAARLYAGAAGLGGIYDHVGVGTMLEEGKEKRVIKGKEYIFQEPIKPMTLDRPYIFKLEGLKKHTGSKKSHERVFTLLNQVKNIFSNTRY